MAKEVKVIIRRKRSRCLVGEEAELNRGLLQALLGLPTQSVYSYYFSNTDGEGRKELTTYNPTGCIVIPKSELWWNMVDTLS